MIERWNRTMKEKLFKYFSANSTRKYIDILDKLVDQYNNTFHSSTGMTPKEASKKKNETKVCIQSTWLPFLKMIGSENTQCGAQWNDFSGAQRNMFHCAPLFKIARAHGTKRTG